MEITTIMSDVFLLLFSGTALLLAVAAAVIIFYLISRRKVQQTEMQLLAMDARHSREMVEQNLARIEEERQRIAKELHDGIGSLLSTLSLKLETIAHAAPSPDTRLLAQECRELSGRSLSGIRDLSHELMPPELELFGLNAALEEFTDQMNRSARLQMHFSSKPLTPEPSPSLALNLYRIVQELVTNTLKHAGAQHVYLTLSAGPSGIELRYANDGTLFLQPAPGYRKGIGISNIESRVRMHGGSIHYPARHQTGFEMIIQIPYPHE